MRTKRGFLPKYGSGQIPMRLSDFLFSADTGNVKLILDNGDIVEFNNNLFYNKQQEDVRKNYGDYGVKKISHKFTCTEVEISELNEEEKKYT